MGHYPPHWLLFCTCFKLNFSRHNVVVMRAMSELFFK
jgi:hypothetical protein